MRSSTVRAIAILLAAAMAIPAMQGANRVEVTPIEGAAGSEVEVGIGLSSDAPASALQVVIELPEGAAWVLEVAGSGMSATGRASGFDVAAGIRDGRLSLMLYSLSRQTIAEGSGEVARLRVRLANKPLAATMAVTAKLSDAAGSALACEAAPVELLSLRPQLEIASGAIDFGRVALTETARRDISLRNTGTADMTVSDVRFDRGEFAVVSALPVRVAPGGSATVGVEFTPAERGDLTAMARIISNSDDTYNGVDLSAAPYAVNELTIGSASGVSDGEVTLPLTLANTDAVNGLTLEMRLPPQLEYVEGSFALNPGSADGHQFTAKVTPEGVLKVMVFSLSNTPFRGQSGEIATLRVRLTGKYGCELRASKAVLSAFYRGEIINVLSDCYGGSVEIMYPSLSLERKLSLGRTAIPEAATAQLSLSNYGNAPLTVSRLEMDNELLEVNAQLPLTIAPYESAEVEIGCAGEATGNIDGTLSVYSNDPELRFTTVEVGAVRYAENFLTFTGRETPRELEQTLVGVRLDNYTPIKGLQFDVEYPRSQLTPANNASATGRAEGFQIVRREVAPGVARYFVYSLTGATINPGSGAVVRLPFDIAPGCPTGELGLRARNFVLSSPELENMNSRLTDDAFAINLTDRLRGDIDGDGDITVFDVTRSIALEVGDEGADEYLHIIDMNGDGEVSVIDITAIISLIINN